MKKLLSLLGSISMIGTASATVVACGNKDKPKEESKEEVAGTLKSEIDEAQGLVNTSKKTSIVTEALQTAINEAQAVLDKKDVTIVELKNASTELSKAVAAFNAAENDPIIVAKEALETKITEAEALVNRKEKEAAAIRTLQAAIDNAKAVLGSKESTTKQLTDETAKLQAAIRDYNNARAEDKRNPKEKLQDKIAEANRLIVLGEKSDEAIQTLKNEIKIAQTTLDKKDVKDDELTSALNKLQTAIDAYKNSAEGIGAWLSRLEKQIDGARLVSIIKGGKKTKKERDDFNGVIAKAENVLQNSKDISEVKAMIEELKKAINEF